MLIRDIEAIWKQQLDNNGLNLMKNWFLGLKSTKAHVNKGTFNQWRPFNVHINLSQAKGQGSATFFSLRYRGRQVAVIRANALNSKVDVDFDQRALDDIFGPNAPSVTSIIPWDSKEAHYLRKLYRDHDKSAGPVALKGKDEHFIESILLKELAKKSSVNKQLLGIQPVRLARCFVQFPTLISASSGKPVATFGHVDILARRRVGREVRLSVWEIKAPGQAGTSSAVEQAYIYAVTLIKTLRTECGNDWYSLFGFSKSVPDRLTVEATVVVESGDVATVDRQFKAFASSNPGYEQIGTDRIEFFSVGYDNAQTGFTMTPLRKL